MRTFILAVLFAQAASAALINGAGATFPYPIYSKWFTEYQKKHPDVQINYQSIGSGGGIRQFTDKTIDFGASDGPMTDKQIADAGAPLFHIPTVLGAVVLSYNLPGVKQTGDKGLKFSPDVIADIFLGKITKWNDPRIVALNPGEKLSGDIVVVHRSDGSGTSFVFTDYLSKVSPEWKERVGSGNAVSWPAGLGGKGNEGVAGLIKQNPGSLGYVELVFAKSNALAYGQIKNAAGEFVSPSLKAIELAAASATVPEDFRVSITNAPGKAAYPIASFTYLLVWKKMPDAKKAAQFQGFLKWALDAGQKLAPDLHYAGLPKAVVERVVQQINQMETK